MVDEESSYEWWVDFSGIVWWDGNPYNEQKMLEKGYILMQFTGVHDKNGKEIYEGDILKASDGKLYEVHWHTMYPALTLYPLKEDGNGRELWEDEEASAEFEIIGDIHENPELTTGAPVAGN